MILSGRLEETTVGDLVAQIYRRGATGTLIIEAHTRHHRVAFRHGYLRSVKLEGHFLPLGDRLLAAGAISREHHRRSLEAIATGQVLQGEALVRLGAISSARLRQELEAQTRERVAYLVGCSAGRWRFEDGAPGDPGMLMHPLSLVRGTPRKRVGVHGRAPRPRSDVGRPPAAEPGRYSLRGLGTTHVPPNVVLGVAANATADQLRREYRRRALELHPDRHPGLDDASRKRLEVRFAAVTAAYEALIARAR